MRLSLSERTSVVCSCCGNRVETMWSFQQEMVVGHFVDGRPIQGQAQTNSVQRNAELVCFGGYSAAHLHPVLDTDENEL